MKRRLLIGIGGPSGSGKTSVAQSLNALLGSEQVLVLEEDNYYRDLSRVPVTGAGVKNFDHPDALDHDLLHQHLKALLAGRKIRHPVYDFRQYRRTGETSPVGPHRVIILEGILILHDPRIRQLMDIKVYVDQDSDVCFIRRLRRDLLERGRTPESVMEQYEATVRPMFLQFVEPTKRYADVIIPGGGHNLVAIDLLATKIQFLLGPRPVRAGRKASAKNR